MVKVDGSPIDLTRCSENTATKLVCTNILSGPISNKKITLIAADSVGYESSIQSEGSVLILKIQVSLIDKLLMKIIEL